ncbi:hypothetical protein IF1G_11168 [Cordyceps javanica]|uniref:Uncharacterized protein n=1 Tax=Cordyceps javanica TaxID=43265 RepID=A0A545VIN1_9HYPO|nr:hypothetical protein IF1G_11168 [Cordyceps javanica]TQW01593.1 hypothetical protein IF2G_10887 [Cordyceps javanica]
MSRGGFQAVSRRISAEKTIKYVGRVEVDIQSLEFPNSESLNKENVERLVRLFRGQGSISPGDARNRIPAVIDEATLQTALTASGLTRDSLLCGGAKYPRLLFQQGFRLECLHGGDRVQASKKVSRLPNPHWGVDLFTADISDEAKRDLIEEYSSEKGPGDGVYYRKIREYQGIFGEQHPYLEHRWWARLGASSKSESKKKQLEQLWKHSNFAAAFDAFQHLPALYCGLRLSAINKMISMGCHEELLSFLRHTKDFWYHVFDGDESAMEKLDEDTVLAVQLKAPGACEKEARTLYAQVHSGCIFGGFNETARNRIWLRLCSATADCLAPSLYAFFENLKYLQAAADCMRRLVPRKANRSMSMRRSFEENFLIEDADETKCIIQTSWSSFRTTQTPKADGFDIAYRQLWLYALREYQSMPIPRQQKLAIAETRHADEVVVFRFACLAQKLGFNTDEINSLVQRSPDEAIARRLLTTARKANEFEFEDMSASIRSVTRILSTAQLISAQTSTEEDDVDDIAEPPLRCGTPHAAHHTRDKPNMFLDKLHESMDRHSSELTSFFIQRSIYFGYFGQDVDVPVASLNATESVHDFDYIRTPGQNLALASARGQRLAQTPGGEIHEQALRSRIDEREARLAELMMKEQQLAAKSEQLQNEITARNTRVLTLRDEEQDALVRLTGLQREEAEQVLRLETLQSDEQERQSKMAQIEQRGANTGEEIRLDLLGTSENWQAGAASQESDVPLPDRDGSSQQEGTSQVEQLLAEEERLRALVADLILQAARLDDDRQSQVASMAAVETQHRAAVEELVAKESALQNKIQQLEAILERLQVRLNETAEQGPSEQCVSVDGGVQQPSSLLGTAREVPDAARCDGDEIEESLAVSGHHNRLALEHMVRQALHSDDEVSIVSAATKTLSVRRQSAASSFVSEPVDELEATRQDSGQNLPTGTEKVSIVFKLLLDGEWRTQHELQVDPAEPSAVQRAAAKTALGE